MIPLGYDGSGKARYYRGPGHVLLVGRPRIGKETDFLSPLGIQYDAGNPFTAALCHLQMPHPQHDSEKRQGMEG
jgi:hypothetical protein